MNLHDALLNGWSPRRDRDVIRVEFAQDKLCIAAALRQAFNAAAHAPTDLDFDRLLSELH